ncbi:MAG: hypothetical protein LBR08_13535 [Bacteroidales bacterium]|jgi:hypothetical protein|nr:hypothetical protein [Bacteroidales bacterium]
MHRSDYIPSRDGDFLEWVKHLFTYVQEHAAEWGLDPMELSNLVLMVSSYETVYNRYKDPNRGSADVLAKNEARDALKDATRQYVREHLEYSSRVSDEERRHAGLPVHDRKPTPSPPITDRPVAEVDFSAHQRHSIHVKVGKLTGRSKPAHASGFEGWRKTGGDAPASDSDWSYAGFSSRSPLVLDYPQTDVGKTVYYRFRWMNTRNQPGPWSETVSAVIA